MKNKDGKIKKNKRIKKTTIGGQAVLEGVMMRGMSSMAIAVRDSEGIIRVESQRITPVKKRNIFFRLPIVRGVVNFFSMLVMGTSTLTKSAEVFGESEPSKFEKWLSKKFKIDAMNLVMIIGVVLGLALAVGLFFVLPSIISINLFQNVFKWSFTSLEQNLVEGGVRLLIFILYLLLVSLLKDIRRTFMYHGAEHRTINCYEKGLDLTVKNIQSCSTVHNRCGTTFLFFVMLISIIVFSVFDGVLLGFGVEITQTWQKVLLKIALLPLVAGLSYELLKLLALSDFFLLYPLKAPGMLLQLITTKKPTDDMAEVALIAFKTVMEMDADQSIAPKEFVKPQKTEVYYEKHKNDFKDISMLDWIMCDVLNCKRNDILNHAMMTISQVEKADRYIQECAAGKPLQYVLGNAEFYGNKIAVSEDVLIPRMDTEILAEITIEEVKDGFEVLELCTGSGAVAIAIKKNTGAKVTASDISPKALKVARSNADNLGVNIELIQSDMFSAFDGRKFDIIVCNPPYIKTLDIENLDGEVKNYEPRLALDGGEDGLDFYRRLSKEAFGHICDDGKLLLEVGINQSEEVAKMFSKETVEIYKDLNGIERVLKITRS